MDRIFEAIEEWMRNLLTGMVSSNLTTMYTDVNEKTGQIAAQVGQTPQGWNGSIYSMIQNLSESVIVPIAGMIITFVLCYELISMLTEKNNMPDIKYRHRNRKGMADNPDCHPHLEKVFKEHPGVDVMHVVLFRQHGDQRWNLWRLVNLSYWHWKRCL